MAHITKIKASDTPAKSPSETEKSAKRPPETGSQLSKKEQKVLKKREKAEKKAARKARRAERKHDRRPMPKWLRVVTAPVRWLVRPFAKLGRYIGDSWQELRQVSWPNRKTAWQLTGTVLLYTAVFVIVLTLLDILFNFIFDNLLG